MGYRDNNVLWKKCIVCGKKHLTVYKKFCSVSCYLKYMEQQLKEIRKSGY